MFEKDIITTSHYESRKDGMAGYASWASAVGIDTIQFPFKVETFKLYKGKPINFNIVSWGCYQNKDAKWVIFINYYSLAPKHTIQYSWDVDDLGMAKGDARKFEFIN